MDHDYDADNRLKQIDQNGVSLNFDYDTNGQRIKKVYQPPAGTMTTWYISPSFEIRRHADGTTTSTKYFYAGAHGKVMSITRLYDNVPSHPVVSNEIFDSGHSSLEVESLIASILEEPWWSTQNMAFAAPYTSSPSLDDGATEFRVLLMILIMGLLIAVLLGQCRQSRFHSNAPAWQKRMAISIIFIFLLTSCAPDPDGGSAPWPKTESTLLGEPDDERLSGTTKHGLNLGIFYYHTDHIGSATVVTDQDGNEVSRMAYTPFGEIDQDRSTGTNPVTHKFTGQELDEESELYYYNARYYDPSLGRFMTADTIVPDPTDLQQFNRYSYVVNNPIRYTDLTGHYSTGAGQDGGASTKPKKNRSATLAEREKG